MRKQLNDGWLGQECCFKAAVKAKNRQGSSVWVVVAAFDLRFLCRLWLLLINSETSSNRPQQQ